MGKAVGEQIVFEAAHAKVNLILDVGERGEDGYHDIDSVILPIALHDDVWLSPREDGEICVEYADGRSYPDDNAKRILKLLSEEYGGHGVTVRITKRIPEGAGLGGSSADAAAVARGYARLYGIAEPDKDLLLAVGSDVPAMYRGGTLRVRGKGERLQPVDLPPLYGVAVKDSREALSTAAVFATYDKVGGERADVERFLARGGVCPVNSLRRAAVTLVPQLANTENLLRQAGFPNVVMSGSGAAYVGYTADAAEYAKAYDKLLVAGSEYLDIYKL